MSVRTVFDGETFSEIDGQSTGIPGSEVEARGSGGAEL